MSVHSDASVSSGTGKAATWSHFEHGADIGVRGEGASLEQAFAQAALALTAVISEPAGVRPREPVPLSVSAPDPELLLVDFLNAVVLEMATRSMLFGRFEVTIRDSALQAVAWGEPVDVARHRPAVEVKGATYTALRVARADGGWVAECVVDV